LTRGKAARDGLALLAHEALAKLHEHALGDPAGAAGWTREAIALRGCMGPGASAGPSPRDLGRRLERLTRKVGAGEESPA
jgi:hypothetical protein